MARIYTIYKQGGSRVLPVTSILPKDWKYFKYGDVTIEGNKAVITVVCLDDRLGNGNKA